MAPVDVGEGDLSWRGTLEAILSMIGERVTVNALSERTGKGVVWISGKLTHAPDFEAEFRKQYPDYKPAENEGELLLVRVVDGPEESENRSGVMLREDEFESAGWFPPGVASKRVLRVLQGGTVIQIARWGPDEDEG